MTPSSCQSGKQEREGLAERAGRWEGGRWQARKAERVRESTLALPWQPSIHGWVWRARVAPMADRAGARVRTARSRTSLHACRISCSPIFDATTTRKGVGLRKGVARTSKMGARTIHGRDSGSTGGSRRLQAAARQKHQSPVGTSRQSLRPKPALLAVWQAQGRQFAADPQPRRQAAGSPPPSPERAAWVMM